MTAAGVGWLLVVATIVGSRTTGVPVGEDGFDEALYLFGVEYAGGRLGVGLWLMWGLRLFGLGLVVAGVGSWRAWWTHRRAPRMLMLGGLLLYPGSFLLGPSLWAGAPKSRWVTLWALLLAGLTAFVLGAGMALWRRRPAPNPEPNG